MAVPEDSIKKGDSYQTEKYPAIVKRTEIRNHYTTHNIHPTKYTILFLRYLYYITLNISICFDPQGIIIMKP